MSINADKPHLWKADAARSIEWYNAWFARAAPQAYQDARLRTATQVEAALEATGNLTRITADVLRQQPRLVSLLRLTTTPPLSREHLSGLTQVPLSLLTTMERDGQIPPHLVESVVDADLQRLGAALTQLADRDICPWLQHGAPLTPAQVHRAAMIIADRLCVATADGVVREAHKQRQVTTLAHWLERRGYTRVETTRRLGLDHLRPATFAAQLNLPVLREGSSIQGAIAIDVALMPAQAQMGDLPVLLDARVAADAGHAHKKRAENAAAIAALRGSYGRNLRLILVLCGYFDSGYLGHAAAEGIDWVWEHRLDDLAQLDDLTSRDTATASVGALPPRPSMAVAASGSARY